jgi:hypothetical protein
MDMKNILQNMDAAAAGKKPSAASADVNDMKTILESIQSVEECGMGEMPQQMPAEPQDKMSMNVTLNAQGDAVADLIKLMGGAATPQEAPVRMPAEMPVAHDHGADDMKALIKLASDDEEVDEAEGEWDNSPDEEYKDHEYMTKDLAGGLNKEKKSYPPANGGDNPMALEDQLKAELKAALEEKFNTLSK